MSTNQAELDTALSVLQACMRGITTHEFERLAAALVGEMLDTGFFIAKSGSQHGGDASTTGRRSLKLEARRYKGDTSLDRRGILGEIEESIDSMPALEAWILATTRDIPDQILLSASKSAEQKAVVFVPLGWDKDGMPCLAALAARFPDITRHFLPGLDEGVLEKIAGDPSCAKTVNRLRRDLESWATGYEAVRQASHAGIRAIWSDVSISKARLHQDVAGSAPGVNHLRRDMVFDGLSAWFDQNQKGQVLVLSGRDGAGKTWAAMDWLQAGLERLPIIIPVSSKSIGGALPANHGDVVRLIARHLHDLTHVRTPEFWYQRVERLLERPAEEGPVFLVLFDGMNETGSAGWIQTLYQFAAPPLFNCTRIVATTRKSHLQARLANLQSVIPKPAIVEVKPYDDAPGGELDQKLQAEGLSRGDLSEGVLELARVPRFFDLVIELRDELSGLAQVTPHRLLYEYGRKRLFDASGETFSPGEWNTFVLKLAGRFRDGRAPTDMVDLADMAKDARFDAAGISSRVSAIVDGVFATLEQSETVTFGREFVDYALGLALIEALRNEAGLGPAQERLNAWLDSILGYDERSGILEAALSLAVCHAVPVAGHCLSAILIALLETQNLLDRSADLIDQLAGELVAPLLDAIENLKGNELASARDMAVNALRGVALEDEMLAEVIGARAAIWRRRISLDRTGRADDGDKHSFTEMRRLRLLQTIGIAEPGTIELGGETFELVDRESDDLVLAGVQLLQGRPLKNAVPFLVTGALHAAVVGPDIRGDALSWLNLLNPVDPQETARRLRAAAEDLLRRVPPQGADPDLYRKAAAILLRRTGYETDSEEAARIEPRSPVAEHYEAEYEAAPSKSYFRPERRHMAECLLDKDRRLLRRIERCKTALLDPNFQPDDAFVQELREAARAFSFDDVSISRDTTRGDLDWEGLSLALARCDPALLAELERARLRAYASRPAKQRFGSALTVTEGMLLIGQEERDALAAFRETSAEGRPANESGVRAWTLTAEIQGLDAEAQYRHILDHAGEAVYASLADAARSPDRVQIDRLVEDYKDDPTKFRQLMDLLAYHDVALGPLALEVVSQYALEGMGNPDGVGTAWPLLSRSAPESFGKILLERDWSWSADRSFWENFHGSTAIAVASRDVPLASVIHRIAPARLLACLGGRRPSRAETELAADIVTQALLQQTVGPPEPVALLTYDEERSVRGHYGFSVGETIEESGGDANPLDQLLKMNDPDKAADERTEIIREAIRRVDEARQKGANLYLVEMRPEDFDIVFRDCPETIETWLDGVAQGTAEASRRVRLAEGFYIALCRSLMKHDPERGAGLWKFLRKVTTTRFIGPAGVDWLTLIPFEAPDSLHAVEMRDTLFGPGQSGSDLALLDLVIAARRYGREDWLLSRIEEDRQSELPLRHRRAVFLAPLVQLQDIAGEDEWPVGLAANEFETLRRRSFTAGQMEAYAHHWLSVYASARDPAEAHAAWKLFEASADKRARAWIRDVFDRNSAGTGNDSELHDRKVAFAGERFGKLKRAMEKQLKDWKKEYTGREIPNGLLPWAGER